MADRPSRPDLTGPTWGDSVRFHGKTMVHLDPSVESHSERVIIYNRLAEDCIVQSFSSDPSIRISGEKVQCIRGTTHNEWLLSVHPDHNRSALTKSSVTFLCTRSSDSFASKEERFFQDSSSGIFFGVGFRFSGIPLDKPAACIVAKLSATPKRGDGGDPTKAETPLNTGKKCTSADKIVPDQSKKRMKKHLSCFQCLLAHDELNDYLSEKRSVPASFVGIDSEYLLEMAIGRVRSSASTLRHHREYHHRSFPSMGFTLMCVECGFSSSDDRLHVDHAGICDGSTIVQYTAERGSKGIREALSIQLPSEEKLKIVHEWISNIRLENGGIHGIVRSGKSTGGGEKMEENSDQYLKSGSGGKKSEGSDPPENKADGAKSTGESTPATPSTPAAVEGEKKGPPTTDIEGIKTDPAAPSDPKVPPTPGAPTLVSPETSSASAAAAGETKGEDRVVSSDVPPF